MLVRPVLVAAVSALVVLGVGITPLGLRAAAPGPQNPAQQGAPPQPQSGMPGMMKMHEQMMAETKAADATLDALVKDMNAAAGDSKLTAMAALVTELVRQHKAERARMGQMHQQMMGGQGMMMGR